MKKFVLFLLFVLSAAGLWAEAKAIPTGSVVKEPAPAAAAGSDLVPEARAAVLMEFSTGRILFEKNPDHIIPPASLTKLVTLHLVYKAIAAGSLSLDQLVPVTKEVAAYTMPKGSSLMFLEEGQRVTVKELMQGVAVASGNDAGMALARFLGGSEAGFVEMMNQEMQNLGLFYTFFYDSFGISANNRTTAGEFARFARIYLTQHPQATAELHSVKDFLYPLPANLIGMKSRYGAILQHNRNTLLGEYEGLDGLKTGYIDEAGYNLAATAQRGDLRYIAIILGVQGKNTKDGSEKRSAAARTLLDYAFNNFQLTNIPLPSLPQVTAWYSEPSNLTLKPLTPVRFPLSAEEKSRLVVKTEVHPQVLGPFKPDTALGKVVWALDGKELLSVPLVASEPVKDANIFVKIWHAILLFFQGLFGGPQPLDLSKPVAVKGGKATAKP